MCLSLCVCVCVCACVRAYVHPCVHVCVRSFLPPCACRFKNIGTNRFTAMQKRKYFIIVVLYGCVHPIHYAKCVFYMNVACYISVIVLRVCILVPFFL